MNKKLFLVPSLFFAFTLTSCETLFKSSGDAEKKEVTLHPKSNSTAAANVTISELKDGGVRVVGKVTGLAPNSTHGFHFHEKGDCSDPEAMKAGGHFNPDSDHVHGESIAQAPYEHQHAGDLGNIKANAAGIANIDLTVKSPKFTLEEGSKYSLEGKAIVVHANQDDEKSAPAGNAGKRILCGVIE